MAGKAGRPSKPGNPEKPKRVPRDPLKTYETQRTKLTDSITKKEGELAALRTQLTKLEQDHKVEMASKVLQLAEEKKISIEDVFAELQKK
jgi:hypothetical protein